MIRLVRFQYSGTEDKPQVSWGVQSAAGIHDLGACVGDRLRSISEAMFHWDTLRGELESILADAPKCDSAVRLLSPVPEGGKVICIGLNYRDHAIESGMDIPNEPVVFNKLPGVLCGPEAPVPIPKCSSQVDYEAELVLVIGREAWQVAEEDAEQYLFGYTCGHDVSARDWQLGRPGGQWLLGKSFPNFAPLGPALVPREFVEDPCDLQISLRLNGETLQHSSTKQLIFSPRELISYISQCCVLHPGDVIFTGTPPGVGMAHKPPRFLQPGDVCEVEIQGLGVLRNRFV